MKFWFTMRSVLIASGISLVLLVALFAWTERSVLLAWYYTYRLSRADDAEVQAWFEPVAALDRAALPRLLGCFRGTDARACANAQAALAYFMERWEPGDARRAEVGERLAERFSSFSIRGQQAALEVEVVALQTSPAGAPSAGLVAPATHVLAEAACSSEGAIRATALKLAGHLLNRTVQKEALTACRQMVRTGLRDERAENRIAAIWLALHPRMNLLEAVVGLLNDPVPEVRRSAMLAVGPSQTATQTDDLLPWLHDPDADVRRLCEKALRSRGLSEEHLHLARLMTDQRAGTRLQVLDLLRRSNDLETGIWLRRLSHDSSAAVRAAAVRAASEQSDVHFSDRLEQMVQNDPSPTVRQVADYYLSSRKLIPTSSRP